MKTLEAFVGDWSMESSFPSPPGESPHTTFTMELGGQFLVQRSEVFKVPNPKAPNALTIIAPDPKSGHYTQHYFDSRGVVRLYEMTFDGRRWTLLRKSADFTPLEFSQRFIGMFSEDGNTIRGTWESSKDGTTWEKDFDLTYTRRS